MEVDSDEFFEDEWYSHLLLHQPAGVLYEIFKHLDWMDLCSLAQTCTKFRDLIKKATIWMQMKLLDFTNCPLPMAEKMLNIVKRCPNAENIRVGGMVLELSALDDFLASVFDCCPHLRQLYINNPSINNECMEVLHRKGENLDVLSVNLFDEYLDSQHLTQVVAMKNLAELNIQQCRSNIFVQRVEEKPTYNIRKLILNDSMLQGENVTEILRSCVHLEYLDLQNSISTFPTDNLPVRNGLKRLKVLNLGQNGLQTLEVEHPFPSLESLNIDMCQIIESVKVAAPLLNQFSCNSCDVLESLELSPCSINSVHLRLESLQTMQINSVCLQEVEISCNKRLSCESFMAAIPHKDQIQILTLDQCEGISAQDLNEILNELPNLRELKVNVGEPRVQWNQAEIRSQTLRILHFGGCFILSSLPVNASTLTSLHLQGCRDFEEAELFDGLLYGKRIQRTRGMECQWNQRVDQAIFENHSGVENLQELYLSDMKGIKGTLLSSVVNNFRSLSKLVIKKCSFFSQLSLSNCTTIEVLCIESCPKFTSLNISNSPNLHILHVQYCSMMQQCIVTANQLTDVDFNGTNFSHFDLRSVELTDLIVQGVCTRESNKINLSCPFLRTLNIQKCDMLTDETLEEIFCHCPKLTSLTILGSNQLRNLQIPESLEVLSVTGLRRLQTVRVTESSRIQHLTLNNLPKFTPSLRMELLRQCEKSLEVLEVRAIPGEINLSLQLTQLKCLTLDQGIHLSTLCIKCPKLSALRVQGCPKLSHLEIEIEKLSQIQVHHSVQLLALHHIRIRITSIRRLSSVLVHYTPNLQSLTIEEGRTSKEEIVKLGRSLCCLENIILKNCVEEDNCGERFSPLFLRRGNNIPLNVSRT
ncbi:uncharacterized protein LOC125670101 [Ostrea edulis]|uniref:uncharacterized protein LOC125670101 n=1 Tax=Ostrea edulis TaxID=37623 RepID=UPI0024AFEEA9|nr:uncharacterized protein LOC125670101 [Ostrea edulis]